MQHNKITISSTPLLRFLGIFIGITLILYYGASIIMPLVVAIIIATILDKPMVKMQGWGLPKWASLLCVILMIIVVFSLLTWLTAWQINSIADDWNTIQDKATDKYNGIAVWVSQKLGVNIKNQLNESPQLINTIKDIATGFISSISNIISQSFIILIYIILLLMQKDMFHKFLYKLSSKESEDTVKIIIEKSGNVVSKYLVGKSKLMLILFVIYYIGFLIGNVPYALFLAFFASLFSIIPYIGNIIGGGMAALLAFIYSGTTAGIVVISVITFAQIIENYVLTPLIIGEDINLNPFITVFGVIVFSILWGVVGAIISLPIIAVLKVIFEYTEGMEAAQFLLEKDEKK